MTPQQRAEYQDYMFGKYGRPEPFPPRQALEKLELGHWKTGPNNNPVWISDITDHEVMAFRYESQEAADAWAEGNLEHNGHPALGSYPDPAGDGAVIGVLDLRPALAALKEGQRGGPRPGRLDG